MARIVGSPRVACSVAAGAAVVLIASRIPVRPARRSIQAGSSSMPVSPDTATGSSNPCLAMGPGRRLSAAPINRPRQSIRKRIRPRSRLQSRARGARAGFASFPNSNRLRLLRHSTRAAAGRRRLLPVGARAAGARRRAGARHYQQAPAQFAVAPPAPTSGWRAVPQAQAPAQVDPRYVASVSPGQLRGSQSQPAGYRTAAAPPAQPDPRYTGSVTTSRSYYDSQRRRVTGRQRRSPCSRARLNMLHRHRRNRSVDCSRRIIRWRPLPKPPRIRSPASIRNSRSGSSLRSDTRRNRSRAMRIRRRPTLPSTYGDMAQQQPLDPRYERQVIEYRGAEKPGTIIVDTPHFFLYLVLDGGRALRYGIGVGRPGFTWAGVKTSPPSANGRIGVRRMRCSSAGPTCRTTCAAVRTIRSAHARSISARRSIGSTARTSLGRSARRCRPAASGCATMTSSTLGRVKVGAKVIVI